MNKANLEKEIKQVNNPCLISSSGWSYPDQIIESNRTNFQKSPLIFHHIKIPFLCFVLNGNANLGPLKNKDRYTGYTSMKGLQLFSKTDTLYVHKILRCLGFPFSEIRYGSHILLNAYTLPGVSIADNGTKRNGSEETCTHGGQ